MSSIGTNSVIPGGSSYVVSSATNIVCNTNSEKSYPESTKLVLLRLTEFIDKEYADQGLIAIAVHPRIPSDKSDRLPDIQVYQLVTQLIWQETR